MKDEPYWLCALKLLPIALFLHRRVFRSMTKAGLMLRTMPDVLPDSALDAVMWKEFGCTTTFFVLNAFLAKYNYKLVVTPPATFGEDASAHIEKL